jgi:FkbM family methyltransferase
MHIKLYLKQFIDRLGYKVYKKGHVPIGVDFDSDIVRFSRDLQVKTIFDVGANIGQTALRFYKIFPHANIFSFEPIQTTFDQLERNTARLPKVNCYHHAFGSKEDNLKIYRQSNSLLNSLADEVNHYSPESEIVKVKTIDQFCRENDIETIDILKTDTEGFELEVIRGAKECLEENTIRFIFLEVGFRYTDKRHILFSEINDYLIEKEFRFCGFYDLHHSNNKGRFLLTYCNALFVNFSPVKPLS